MTTPIEPALRPAERAHSFTAALCGFVGSTIATTMVLVLLSGL